MLPFVIMYAADPVVDPANKLLDYGLLGLILLIFLVASVSGYIWFRPGVEALRTRLEQSDATNDRLTISYEKEVIPALVEAVHSIKGVTIALEEMTRSNKQTHDRLDEHVRVSRELVDRLSTIEQISRQILAAIK